MARIPIIARGNESFGRPDGALGSTSGVGEGLERGLSQLGGALRQVAFRNAEIDRQREAAAQRIDEARFARQAARGRLDTLRALNEFDAAASTSMAPEEIEPAFESLLRERRRSVTDGIDDTARREELGLQIDELAERFRPRVLATVARREADEGLAALDSSLAAFTEQAVRSDDPREAQGFIADGFAEIGQMQRAGVLSDVQAGETRRRFSGEVLRTRTAVGLERDPAGTLDDLRNERIRGLPEAQRLEFIARGEGILDRRRREQLAGLRPQVNDVTQRLETGFAVDADRIAGLRQQARGIGAEDEVEALNRAERLAELQRQTRFLPPTAMAGLLLDAQREARDSEDVSSEQIERLQFLERQLETTRRAVAEDPLAHAARVGLIDEVAPVSLDDPSSLRARGEQAEAVAGHFGAAPRFFTADERRLFTASLEQADADGLIAQAATLLSGFGPERIGPVLQEIGADSPGIAHAAGLAVTGRIESARLAVDGARARKAGSEVDLPAVEVRAQADARLGDAFRLLPELDGTIRSSARDIFTALAIRRGVRGFDEDLFAEALDRAAGGDPTTGLGGIGRFNGGDIVLPGTVDESGFRARLRRLSEDDLVTASASGGPPTHEGDKPVPVTPDEVRDARLVSIGEGQYLVETPNGFAADRQGQQGLYVLDFNRLGAPADPRAVGRELGPVPDRLRGAGGVR